MHLLPRGNRPDKLLNRKGFVARMDLWAVRERVDGLEADPEPADRRNVLGAFGDSANATDIPFIKRPTKVADTQAVVG